jgi:ribosomal-protein-alanine N-acetyltransferase
MSPRADLKVRPALIADTRPIANLIQFSPQVHRHLDWRDPLGWIGTPPFFVLESQGQVIAALGCPPDPPSIAWVRLFVNSGKIALEKSWELLWNSSREDLKKMGQHVAAVIVIKDWFHDLLKASGFTSPQSIVMLERDGGTPPSLALENQVTIRSMRSFDLPAVAEVDALAFEILWQNSLPVLERAFPQAFWPSVAEYQDEVVGYQLSTRNSLGVHLARLAVRPSWQGKGLGYALVADLIQKAGKSGITHLTVNTQSDNAESLALYQKLDFRETRDRYPVYLQDVSSE